MLTLLFFCGLAEELIPRKEIQHRPRARAHETTNNLSYLVSAIKNGGKGHSGHLSHAHERSHMAVLLFRVVQERMALANTINKNTRFILSQHKERKFGEFSQV